MTTRSHETTPEPLSAPGRGWFITLEGPDGAGKSSQVRRLVASLAGRGHAVVATREPGGTQLGERIRALLLAIDGPVRSPMTDALLFNAARHQLMTDVIGPAIRSGTTVVCDRFSDSTLAYQGFGEGLDRAQLQLLAQIATDGLQPDLTILLDLPVEIGLERRAAGAPADLTRFEQGARHDRAFHERVRAGFLELARDEPDRWRVVDAARDVDLVAAEIEWYVTRLVG